MTENIVSSLIKSLSMEGHCITWQINDPFCKDNNNHNEQKLITYVVNLYRASS